MELILTAADGRNLHGRLFLADSPRGMVVIAPATAVPARFYHRISRYLAANGYHALVFDYRGIGRSRTVPLSSEPATMSEWGAQDLQRALLYAFDHAGALPVYLLGHSFGGQALGLAPAASRLAGALTIGSQSGYIGHWAGTPSAQFRLGIYVTLPLLARTVGYVPGWAGMGEDLPGGVAREWARWCRSKGYLCDHVPEALGQYAAIQVPVELWAISDDPFAPIRAVRALGTLLPRGRVRMIHPQDAGVDTLGHFNLFRENAQAIWPQIIERFDRWSDYRARQADSLAS